MRRCPHCGSDLIRGTAGTTEYTQAGPTYERRTTDIVACPDCGGAIDGFVAD